MDLSVVPYGEMGSRVEVGRGGGGCGERRAAEQARSCGGRGGGGGGGKYRECMRNHAAAIGGQAYDGCGEFMPGGEGGSLEALKCAACGCHRNFHRREGSVGAALTRRPLLLAPPPAGGGFPAFLPPPIPVPFHQIRPPASACDGNRGGSETPPRREEDHDAAARSKKRCRTRFTAEQKEKMQAFAEKLGWRIQKHDHVALQEFCIEIGVKRHVLKVWMHNNKNALSSSASKSSDAAAAAAAAPPPISV